MRVFPVFYSAAAVLCLCAAEPPSPASAKKAPARSQAPSDLEIEKELRARLARSKMAADKFQVRVSGGVATIEGRTAVIQRKGAMTRMAKAAGAKKVVNKIEIDEAARERASANLQQGRRRAQIKRGEPRSAP